MNNSFFCSKLDWPFFNVVFLKTPFDVELLESGHFLLRKEYKRAPRAPWKVINKYNRAPPYKNPGYATEYIVRKLDEIRLKS